MHGTVVFFVFRLLYAGPGIESEEEFEAFCEYANRVEMDNAEFHRLERVVSKHMPSKPLYVCTIQKSHTVRGKAKMVNIRMEKENLPYIFLPLRKEYHTESSLFFCSIFQGASQ